MQVTDSKIYSATLVESRRITPATSPEDVRHLVFRTDDPSFDGKVGGCIRVLAPGQYGNKHHVRLYSILDVEEKDAVTEFAVCVRRCHYVDDFSGEKYDGVASNHLCDLRAGDALEFVGPVSYPFVMPKDRSADILMIGMGTGIAPFRGLIRLIYEKMGSWTGRVRLFHGARSGLEMLYLNDENNDLANYYDQPTFKAFQAVSPRPAFEAPVALDQAIEQNAAEVWSMMQGPTTLVYVAGTHDMLAEVEKVMAKIAGSAENWQHTREALVAEGRWSEVLY